MDPALLRKRSAFLAKARSTPVVERRKFKDRDKDENDESAAKKPKVLSSKPKDKFDYKTMPGSSQYKFSILAKIVKHMKTRHQQGDIHPLSIEDILDETNQLDVNSKQKHWLITEALVNNPKIDVVDGNRFVFKPKYNIRDKRSLMKLLKNHDLHGTGGILQEDIEESIPNAHKVFKHLGENIIYVTRPSDKKKVLYYNDKYCQFKIDEEFKKMWRSVTVVGMDEAKIDDYLEKQGITLMQDVGIKKVTPAQKRKKSGSKKQKSFKKLNDHLQGVLEDYSDLANKQN